MTLIPMMSWYDTHFRQIFQSSMVPDPNQPSQPLCKSLIHVPVLEIKTKILNKDVHKELKEQGMHGLLPSRSNPTDAGLDLYAAEDVLLTRFKPDYNDEKHRATVATGVAVEMPPGLGLFIWDRSGLSAKHGIHRVAGVVDSSYRGQIKVALVNLTADDYKIHKGDRIAQAIISPVILAQAVEVDELSDTSRGAGGFGSTGG